ncbi:MAG TPA: EAL domain-containing protein [Burkholderiales bacterium]|jgi:diguanylate cyclase (GGDEF)-like protein|nr:EAL domain-containing protein [Burkholderiales bacterium]
MRLEGTFLRSKVARRVLLLFLLAAFIPFLALSYLYFVESNRALVRESHVRLQATSASFGRTIYDRLLLADKLLRSAADDIRSDSAPTAIQDRLGKTFRSLSVVSPHDSAIRVFGDAANVAPLDEATSAGLRQGGSLLTIREASSHRASILLVQALSPAATDPRLVAAEIDAGYLWGDPETFPYAISYCVLSDAYAGLYCPPPFQPQVIGTLMRSASPSTKGQLTWHDGQETFLANFSEIFLEARFLAPRWLVVATQPEAVALGRSVTFNLIFWSSIVFSVLLVTLLSLTQIRRTLVPLERLIEGTRRLGRQDFTTRVEVASDDEFGEVAGSFNAMAARLGRQFDALKMLSKIDRAILSELDMDRIVEGVLLRLRETLNAGCASIAVIDHDSPENVRAYAVADHGVQPPVERCTLPAETRETLRANPAGLWMSGETARRTMEGCLESLNARHFFTLPIIWKDQLFGVLSLGYPVVAELSDEDMSYIRDYADRVAVALSTAAREGQLYHQARTDALTDLPNRFFFLDQLQQDIVQTQRGGGKLALLFVDLDRFKSINDSFGHSAGDELLREAAARLRQCVREGDTVARLGGDEFTILINPLASTKTASAVAEHVLAALSKPFLIENLEHVVTASIGIAVYPSDGANAEELMRNADTAMYRAKDGGRGTYVFFEEAMNAEVVRRSTLERELRHAISEQQFILHYQPQVDPRTGKVRGVEALLRWRHPELGIVGPDTFVVVAEETGLIAAIGQIVLAEACAQFSAWRAEGVGLEYVAVNVSSRQFRQPNFVEAVEAALRTHAVPAECLELEITESVLLNDTDTVVAMLEELKSLGVRISIDDFGTGYSSMAYLERLPFDTLKIDISFIRKIRDDGEGGTIAATILAMAHSLGKSVVAEGVQTQAQVDFLRKLKCELVQGYIYSRPLPPADLATLVSSQQASKVRKVGSV